MLIQSLQSVTYWRKTYPVEAIRLTPDNIQQIADYLGAEYCTESAYEPYIDHGGDEGYAGEWLVKQGNNYRFCSHEEFMKAFHTHDEQVANDERYAKIFTLVESAMTKQDAATYHQDQTGMDLLVIETVKKIIGEL